MQFPVRSTQTTAKNSAHAREKLMFASWGLYIRRAHAAGRQGASLGTVADEKEQQTERGRASIDTQPAITQLGQLPASKKR